MNGMAQVVNGEREMTVRTHEWTSVPAESRRRRENPAREALTILIEVRSRDFPWEGDIVRFDVKHGRVREVA